MKIDGDHANLPRVLSLESSKFSVEGSCFLGGMLYATHITQGYKQHKKYINIQLDNMTYQEGYVSDTDDSMLLFPHTKY